MTAIAFFLEVINQNLLLGFVPESLGLLLFGIGLIVLTVLLRWILSRVKADDNQKQNELKN